MIGWLLRLGVSRGVLQGNRVFASLGALAAAFRLLQKIADTQPKTLMTHELKPGEVVMITQVEKAPKKARKKRKNVQRPRATATSAS